MQANLLAAFWILFGSAWGMAAPGSRNTLMHAESPHYELIAPCRIDFCVEILSFFEFARLLLEKNLKLKPPRRKMLVYVVPSADRWATVGEAARFGGYYVALPSRDAIVLKNFDGWAQSGLHELIHLWVHHTFGHLPAWLNEGLAVYFEGTRQFRDGLRTGLVHQGRVQLLLGEKWLPGRVVFSVAHPHELRKDREVQLFYSQSWAMVHFLRLSPRYGFYFDEFLELLRTDVPVEVALARAFGLTPEQLMRESQKWVNQIEWPEEILQKPAELRFKAEISPARTDVLEIIHATVSEFRRSGGERQQRYEALRQKYPQDCGNAILFGDLAYAFGLVEASLHHYKEALRCGASRDLLAEGIRAAIAVEGQLTHTDQTSLEELTGSGSLVLDLAIVLFRHRQFLNVLKMTEDLGAFRQHDAVRAVRLRALALSHLGRYEEAEKEARRLMAMARNDFEKQSAELTLKDVRDMQKRAGEDVETPLEERILKKYPKAEGWLVLVDCMQSWARVHILTAEGNIVRLGVLNAREVVTEDMKELELRCGPQKSKVIVAYEPVEDAARQIKGKVRYFRLLIDR